MMKISLLGTGLIGTFYTMSLHAHRRKDVIHTVCSIPESSARDFAMKYDIPKYTENMKEAIEDDETEVVIVALPNYLHKDAILMACKAKKHILCTKPLALNAEEAREVLDAVEKAGVFHGYLEDLVYTPKTLKAIDMVNNGSCGRILWTRSREAHSGPHSAWFWDKKQSGGGALVDMGCHCIEIGRSFIGKDIKPVEAMCWAETQVKPIEAEDHAIALIKYENGAISQVEVSWNFRGGMDLRDEVSGTEGTIRLDHWLRTGFEVFTTGSTGKYVSEKTESDSGWLFPVGDEVHALGYPHMFTDMLDSLEQNRQPRETFYDGYVVNAIMDACYKSAKSKKWENIDLVVWRGKEGITSNVELIDFDDHHFLIKKEKMPDGKIKLMLKEKSTGSIVQKYVDE
ncbi:MAG: oxidoreductase [Bacteroidetes bacterium GWE2_41_25]|nr:MAG: oxidoreductase [Bacteroidetes bacterium GWA2_40_15]OFX90051.1 MAG: oxidoreductase [Bacteroidetes bacterium GWC2_40_22]OFX95088.1 MAG: oxidoreductase [Bacteroidetes bacterium GWE2_41_25]OFY58039.1 MAG: oxidoreductase [Bacteroidetes bacterium GWF2_41_9]HAM11594.1 oxidoreductase [Bacteroidales bacterium]